MSNKSIDIEIDLSKLESTDNKLTKYESDIAELTNEAYYNAKVVTKELNKRTKETDFQMHIQSKNPHELEAKDLGVYTIDEVNDLLDELPSSTNLKIHELDKNNPHQVTADQVNAYDKQTIDSITNAIDNNINVSKQQSVDISKAYIDDLIFFDDSDGVTGPSNKINYILTYKEDKNYREEVMTDSHERYPTSKAVLDMFNEKVGTGIPAELINSLDWLKEE